MRFCIHFPYQKSACNNIVKLILTVSASPFSAYILYMITPQLCVRRDLQHLVCIVWLTALFPLITTCHLWIPAYLTARKQQCIDMHRYQHISKEQEPTTFLYFFIFAPNATQFHVGIMTHGESCVVIVPNWKAGKCFSLTAFCFGEWAIPLCGLVFSLWCSSCSVILSVWV